MKEILSYCGYRCDLCPAHRGNLKDDDDRRKVSEDWIKYYDLKVEPCEVDCDGCVAASEAPNPNCKVRPCAMERGVENCARCDDFVCEKIRRQIDAVEPIATKHAESMPPEDHERYIAPYRPEARLRKIRGNEEAT